MVRRVWDFISTYSVLLMLGAVLALVWANVDAHSYHWFVEYPLWFNDHLGPTTDHWHHMVGHDADRFLPLETTRVLTMHYLVNDMLMAFFFAVAGKEVWEAIILKNGSLRGRKAATPLFATFGGMVGPIAVYLGLASVLGSDTYSAIANGWAIPTATDIAFSYLVGRVVFGAGHPAVRFLLLLAIADDAAGLVIIAVFYPQGDLAPQFLLLSVFAAVAAFVIFNWFPRYLDRGDQSRKNSTFIRRVFSFWPYLAAGCVSWYGFMLAGLHPSLGLLPIVAAIPHADRDFGFFAEEERHMPDLLNRSEHLLEKPVEFILFLFGLLNAGVEFGAIGAATWLVLAGLVIGKPVGILACGWFAATILKLGLPDGMRTTDLIVIGFVAAIGFTVALFVASVAFPVGETQDAAKMGALFSFGAVLLSILAGKVFRVEKWVDKPTSSANPPEAQTAE